MDPLRVLKNQAGVAFASFPPTFRALYSLTANEMTALLNHCGLAEWGSNKERIQRIKRFIGMRI
jgi:hypothetical protein